MDTAPARRRLSLDDTAGESTVPGDPTGDARLIESFYDHIVPRLMVDGLHPSVDGHAVLAERLEPVLQELLGA